MENLKLEKQGASTYIFKSKKDGSLFPTYPLFTLSDFSEEENVHTYFYMLNTCQINKAAMDMFDANPFFGYFCECFMDLDRKEIVRSLIKKAEKTILSTVKLFDGENNLENPKNKKILLNENLYLSFAELQEADIANVTFDDYLNKYFETLRKSDTYRYMLYYKNLNIIDIKRQLSTGVTNFNLQILRKKLLENGYYLSVDGKIYPIENERKKLIKLLLGTVIENDTNKSTISCKNHESFKQDAEALLKYVFVDNNGDDIIKQEYQNKNIEYSVENKRFEMRIDGEMCDATGLIYTEVEKILINDNIAAENFFGSKDNKACQKFLGDSVYNKIISETRREHTDEILGLIENAAKVFDYDVQNVALNFIKFSNEEKQQLEKKFYNQSPLEFFFRDPAQIKNLNTISRSQDRDIMYYVFDRDIDGKSGILSDEGVKFLEKVKAYLFGKQLVKKEDDTRYNGYKSEGGSIESGNKNYTKTKIEISFIKALIECFQCGNDLAYDHFFERLADYLNYFFYNKKNLSKEESDTSYKDLFKSWLTLNAKMGKEMNKDQKQVQALKTQIQKLEEQFLNPNDLIIDEFRENVLQIERDILDFKNRFIGFQEETFENNIVKEKIRQFAKSSGLNWSEEDVKKILDKVKYSLVNSKAKPDYKLFCLYLNYFVKEAEIESKKIADGMHLEDSNLDNIDAELDFKIFGLIIKYKTVCGISGTMTVLPEATRILNLLEFFVYATCMMIDKYENKVLARAISNASDLLFFMSTNPQKLINLVAEKKMGVVNTLISILLKKTGLEDDKKTIRSLKEKICHFIEKTESTDHMTQLDLIRFKKTDRHLKNLIIYRDNGVLDVCCAPLQKIDQINGTDMVNTFFKKGTKFVDTNQKCKLVLDSNDSNSDLEELSDVDALDYFDFDFDALMQAGIEYLCESSYLFELCIRKKPEILLNNDEDPSKIHILRSLKVYLDANKDISDNINAMSAIQDLLDMKNKNMSLASASYVLECMAHCSSLYQKTSKTKQNSKLDKINFIELTFKAIEKISFTDNYLSENRSIGKDNNRAYAVDFYKRLLVNLDLLFRTELEERKKNLDDLLRPEQKRKLIVYLCVLYMKIFLNEQVKDKGNQLEWIGKYKNIETLNKLKTNIENENKCELLCNFRKYLVDSGLSYLVDMMEMFPLEPDLVHKVKLEEDKNVIEKEEIKKQEQKKIYEEDERSEKKEKKQEQQKDDVENKIDIGDESQNLEEPHINIDVVDVKTKLNIDDNLSNDVNNNPKNEMKNDIEKEQSEKENNNNDIRNGNSDEQKEIEKQIQEINNNNGIQNLNINSNDELQKNQTSNRKNIEKKDSSNNDKNENSNINEESIGDYFKECRYDSIKILDQFGFNTTKLELCFQFSKNQISMTDSLKVSLKIWFYMFFRHPLILFFDKNYSFWFHRDFDICCKQSQKEMSLKGFTFKNDGRQSILKLIADLRTQQKIKDDNQQSKLKNIEKEEE